MFTKKKRLIVSAALAASALFAVTACSPGGEVLEPDDKSPDVVDTDNDFSLDQLIADAKLEEGITVYDSTGKIVDIAEAFSEKYDLDVTGVKMKANDQIETALRESRAKNIQSDVFIISDVPTTVAELLEQDIVTSWFPPDLESEVPEEYRNPPQITTDPNVWAYNTEVFGDTCPVNNMWQLTTPEYNGKIVFQDVALKPSFFDWFNQMALDKDTEMRAAYKELFGKDLETDLPSATHEWVKQFQANGIRLTNSSEDIAEAIGAPGLTDPSFGMSSVAKFRENQNADFKLGICREIKPWIGPAYGKVAVIAAGTKSPNTSKLFVRYLFTQEGIASQLDDGKPSTNTTIQLPSDEPSGVGAVMDDIFTLDAKFGSRDFDDRNDWSDFWIQNK